MPAEQNPPNTYDEAALLFFWRELQHVPYARRLGLMRLIEPRLAKSRPLTDDELQGIKELILEHLRHPAMDGMHDDPSQQSPTMSEKLMSGTSSRAQEAGGKESVSVRSMSITERLRAMPKLTPEQVARTRAAWRKAGNDEQT